MLTRLMKWVAIAALLFAAAFWDYTFVFQLPLRFLVALGAFLVGMQAVRAGRRSWAVGFHAVALFFNPFLPLTSMSGSAMRSLVLATAAAFAVSLIVLKTQPLLSIPSITGRTPGSVSL